MQDFKGVKVWEKSHDLTFRPYKFTSQFPREEMYGLASQIRRACASIPTNIAEGCDRESCADFARFLQIAWVSQRNRISYATCTRSQIPQLGSIRRVNGYG